MDRYAGIMNSSDSQRGWIDNLCDQFLSKRNSHKKVQASAKIAKYAELICAQCKSPHTKDYVVNQLKGICAECNHDDWIDIAEQKKVKEEKTFECTGCNEVYARNSLKKGFRCACGSIRFVSVDMLQSVIANTADYLTKSGFAVDDVWHEKGKVFASVRSQLRDGTIWKTNIVASGNFTKNDVILFSINEDGGLSTVATIQDDPLIKLAKNDKCESYWETIEEGSSQVSVNADSAVLSDSKGRPIRVGSKVEWYTKKGPMRGEVVEARENGNIVVGMTYDEYGPSPAGAFGTMMKLNQSLINQYEVESF